MSPEEFKKIKERLDQGKAWVSDLQLCLKEIEALEQRYRSAVQYGNTLQEALDAIEGNTTTNIILERDCYKSYLNKIISDATYALKFPERLGNAEGKNAKS